MKVIQNTADQQRFFSFATEEKIKMATKNTNYNLVTVLGPTATGKTALASHLAVKINGEVISGDSRQVYRGMDIGTGKDYIDYFVEGEKVPAHLVDIEEPGVHYNVYRFQNDFATVYHNITLRNRFPVLCGGSGLYLEAILKDYRLIQVPPNPELRKELEGKSLQELTEIIQNLKPRLHNKTDVETDRRAIRAIEIEMYYREHPEADSEMPDLKSLNIGVKVDREVRRKRISDRLHQRLEDGMVEEVRRLLDSGLTADQLIYYGLEYKYVTLYVTGRMGYNEMFKKLEIAIHQFAKRQMTWFRGMEKRGTSIFWIDGLLPMEEKVNLILELLNK